MCNTAYGLILSFPENELAPLRCDLKNKKIFSRDKVIFSDGNFHDCGGADVLNALPLIDSRRLPEVVWIKEIQELHAQFQNCFPKRLRRHVNFYPNLNLCPDENTGLDFHRRRLALELYILLHASLGNFEWKNQKHFMKVVAPDCVIYYNWIKHL